MISGRNGGKWMLCWHNSIISHSYDAMIELSGVEDEAELLIRLEWNDKIIAATF